MIGYYHSVGVIDRSVGIIISVSKLLVGLFYYLSTYRIFYWTRIKGGQKNIKSIIK